MTLTMCGMALMMCGNDGGYAGFSVALPPWIPAFAGMTLVMHSTREGRGEVRRTAPPGSASAGMT